MTQSDDLTRKQHDVDELKDLDPNKGLNTPEDDDDEVLEGGEAADDLDELHERAFGDGDADTIGDEINKDEIANVKNLIRKQQSKKN